MQQYVEPYNVFAAYSCMSLQPTTHAFAAERLSGKYINNSILLSPLQHYHFSIYSKLFILLSWNHSLELSITQTHAGETQWGRMLILVWGFSGMNNVKMRKEECDFYAHHVLKRTLAKDSGVEITFITLSVHHNPLAAAAADTNDDATPPAVTGWEENTITRFSL